MALLVAMYGAVRAAIWSPDPEIAYWAGVVFVYAVAVGASLLSGPPFVGPGGVQFWALLGALYGAQERSRVNALKAKTQAAEL